MIAAWEIDAEGAPTGAPLARDEARRAWDAEAGRALAALAVLGGAAEAGHADALDALEWLDGLAPRTPRGREAARLREILASLEPALEWLDAEAQGLTGVQGPQDGAEVLAALEYVDLDRAAEGGAEVAALLALDGGADLLAAWLDHGGRDRTAGTSSRWDAEVLGALAGSLATAEARRDLERAEQRRDSGAER